MASDILTIASSTAETERSFNGAGQMITSNRNHLGRAFVGQAQSMASWSDLGIYRPTMPIHLLQSQDWYDRLIQENIATPLPDGVQLVN